VSTPYRRAVLISLPLLITVSLYSAEKHIDVDTGECGSYTPISAPATRSAIFSDAASGIKAYGAVLLQRSAGKGPEGRCHVFYKLFIAIGGQTFRQVKEIDSEIDDGQIAGIELIGLSPDKTKLAANFWTAEGDSQSYGPVVYDRSTNRANYLALEDRIQKRLHGCDQIEDFIGVTNAGEAVFAIPPSEYSDTSECGDKGIWRFNLKTGKIDRVAKISGDKW
jgi:hypothetical protein